MKIRSTTLRVIGVAALLLSTGLAAANPIFSFTNITNNNAADAAIGEAQLRMEVIDLGLGPSAYQVGFKFTNIGPAASSITDIYFDDGTLLGISSIINNAGSGPVSFTQNASPPNLPGGNSLSPPFETTAGFSAQATSPAAHNGVNNTLDGSESVTIVFDLINSHDFASLMHAFTLGGAEGGLRVGLHVQAFAGGGSESFVNGEPPYTPPPVIPLPGAAGLAAAGLLIVGARRRRGC